MIIELGAFALILALVLAMLQAGLATAGRLRRSPVLAGAAEGAALACAVAVALAFAVLILAFWAKKEMQRSCSLRSGQEVSYLHCYI